MQALLTASISAVTICNNLLVYNSVFHNHKYIEKLLLFQLPAD